MLNIKKVEFKDIDTAKKNIDLNSVHYKYKEIPAKLFKSKKIELIYINKEEIFNLINEFISTLSKSCNMKIKCSIEYINDCYNVNINAEDNSKLIGKDGKMINSIQLLLHQIINNLTDFNLRINVDVANYKVNKEKRLEREIKKIAKEVITSKIEAKLDPMNSYDRRLVHTIIAEYEDLETESFGENPNRYVVIRHKEQ